MRICALVVVSMSILVSTAFAITGDLSIRACPGDPTAVNALDLDCATGGSVAFFGVFSPSIDLPDLVGLDVQLRLSLTNGTFADSPFWNVNPDFAPFCGTDPNTGVSHLSMSRFRPVTGCEGYLDPWTETGSGDAVAFIADSPGSVRIFVVCTRVTPLSVSPGQKLFGFQAVVDMANATQAGGNCAGCVSGVKIELTAASLGGPTTSDGRSVHCEMGICDSPLDTITFNDTAVPVRPRTWGRLKSLYR